MMQFLPSAPIASRSRAPADAIPAANVCWHLFASPPLPMGALAPTPGLQPWLGWSGGWPRHLAKTTVFSMCRAGCEGIHLGIDRRPGSSLRLGERLIPLTQVRLYVVGGARGAGRRFCEDYLA
jgi:hypothetical protein